MSTIMPKGFGSEPTRGNVSVASALCVHDVQVCGACVHVHSSRGGGLAPEGSACLAKQALGASGLSVSCSKRTWMWLSPSPVSALKVSIDSTVSPKSSGPCSILRQTSRRRPSKNAGSVISRSVSSTSPWAACCFSCARVRFCVSIPSGVAVLSQKSTVNWLMLRGSAMPPIPPTSAAGGVAGAAAGASSGGHTSQPTLSPPRCLRTPSSAAGPVGAFCFACGQSDESTVDVRGVAWGLVMRLSGFVRLSLLVRGDGQAGKLKSPRLLRRLRFWGWNTASQASTFNRSLLEDISCSSGQAFPRTHSVSHTAPAQPVAPGKSSSEP